MKKTFAEALEKIHDQSKGWQQDENLRYLSNPALEETQAFADTWFELEDNVRFQLATLLADLAEQDPALAFEALFDILLEDDMPAIRTTAITQLSPIADESLARRFLWLLRNDPAAEVRAEAATALGTSLWALDSDTVTARALEQEITDALLEVFHTAAEDVLVRQRALEAYAYSDDPFVHEVLEDAYDSEEDEISASAVFAMGHCGGEDWLPIVHRELRSQGQAMRLAAIYAAGQIGSSDSISHLLRVIGEDPDEEVRVAAVYALAEIESPEASRILEDLLESNNIVIAAAADDALEMQEDYQDFDNLLLIEYGLVEEESLGGNGHHGSEESLEE